MNLKQYSKRSVRIQDSSEDYSSWKIEAVGDGEVRDLFDFMRKEGSNLDKEFIKKVYNAFPDMPMSVKILRGGDAVDEGYGEEFSDELYKEFGDAFQVLYCNDFGKCGVCDIDDLYDNVGDGNNPYDVYVATYYSDGSVGGDTLVLIYGNGWYKVTEWDEDEVADAVLENILSVDNGLSVLNECCRRGLGKTLV